MTFEPKRDRWGRPRIPQPDGSEIAYTRVSTMAGSLDDKSALMDWYARMAAVGVVKSPALQARISAILSRPGNPLEDAKRDLKELAEQAREAAGSSVGADIGTALHDFTETIDRGGSVQNVPEELEADLFAYIQVTKEFEWLAFEQFVVIDELQAAGSFDRLVRLPDGRVVVSDLKTGQHEPRFPHRVAIQIAAYAHGQVLDAEGNRGPIHPDLDKEVGVLIHLPSRGGRCDVYELDLVKGWELAQLASRVHASRKVKAKDLASKIDIFEEGWAA